MSEELEEGEICEASSDFNLDSAFPHIDQRLEAVLGHFRKNFEGDYTRENLGPMFGGYGTFLPVYLRHPSNITSSSSQTSTTSDPSVQAINCEKKLNVRNKPTPPDLGPSISATSHQIIGPSDSKKASFKSGPSISATSHRIICPSDSKKASFKSIRRSMVELPKPYCRPLHHSRGSHGRNLKAIILDG